MEAQCPAILTLTLILEESIYPNDDPSYPHNYSNFSEHNSTILHACQRHDIYFLVLLRNNKYYSFNLIYRLPTNNFLNIKIIIGNLMTSSDIIYGAFGTFNNDNS